MRRFMIPIIALAVVAAPAALEAQTPRGERPAARGPGPFGLFGPQAGAANPAARVLQQREALGLTAEQVRQLEQLQAQITQRNEPLLRQLQAARPEAGQPQARMQQMTPEQREQMRARMQERQAQITADQRAEMQARREQMRTATPEERTRLRAEMQEHMTQRRQQMQEQMTAEQRAQMEQRRQRTEAQRAPMETLRPVMQQLRESTVQARRDVQAVLTEDQQARLRALNTERSDRVREQRRGPGERPAAGGAGARRMQPRR
jgi:colicin import membrane protein